MGWGHGGPCGFEVDLAFHPFMNDARPKAHVGVGDPWAGGQRCCSRVVILSLMTSKETRDNATFSYFCTCHGLCLVSYEILSFISWF